MIGMMQSNTQFASVLPHEPLPSHPYGYVHLQGAFVPKRKEGNKGVSSPVVGCCKCTGAEYIQTTLTSSLTSLINLCGMNSSDIITVEPIVRESDICKVRIQLSTPSAARTLTSRLRRGNYGPRDLLASTITTINAEEDATAGITVKNEGVCPFGCGGRYGGRAVAVTLVTPITNTVHAEHDSTIAGDDYKTKLTTDQETIIRWERAAPPKFRRLVSNSNSTKHNLLTKEEIKAHRATTRFVYLENVLGNELASGDLSFLVDNDDNDNDNDCSEGIETIEGRMKDDLLLMFRGKCACITANTNANNIHMGVIKNGLLQRDARVEDDIRHAFQEALRDALSLYDTSPNSSSSRGYGGDNNTGTHQCQGIEVFMKTDVSAGIFDNLHIGMRNDGDASRVIHSLQGERLQLKMVLPTSFLQYAADSFRAISPKTLSKQKITITTGKLYLDYADVILPKKGTNARINRKTHAKKVRGEPSRSECTSATAGVQIDGLHVIPNFVNVQEERMLMAGLTGPHAPWAPPQYTPEGGHIKRRVQHYGYVFDYESSDVLRRDDSNDKRQICPPLPCMDADVAEMTDEEVEAWTERAVTNVKVWDVLAGVIERTRRFDVSSSAKKKINLGGNLNDRLDKISLDHNCDSTSQSQSYPDLNQLTVNEYNPGEGIGSHVDTVTAFDDGLLIITLNGGIVMEFRAAAVDEKTRKVVYLPPRSLAVLSGDARYKYEHMIVSRMTDTVDGEVIPRKLRISLTLRTALTAPILDGTAERFSLAQSKVSQSPLPKYESKRFPPHWGQLSDAALTNTNKKGSSDNGSSSDRSALFTPATERKHVHQVYDAIATQWNHTRGKRGVLWTRATQFLKSIPPGSIVADVGCGDGKYFAEILKHSYVIGTDISEPLLRTAATRDHEVDDSSRQKGADGPQYQYLSKEKQALSANPALAVADCIHVPLRSSSCDAAICIAVMHHLSTEQRRIRCLAELKRIVKEGGMINVQAWALEQDHDSKRKFHGTDVLVPFNAQPKYLQTPRKSSKNSNSAGKGVAQMMAEQYDGAKFDDEKNLVVFQRYCHMYRRGELESLCKRVPGLQVVESSFEKGNHTVSLRVCKIGNS